MTEEPKAYLFEVRGKFRDEEYTDWMEMVRTHNPEETYGTYGGFELKNITPLYPKDD